MTDALAPRPTNVFAISTAEQVALVKRTIMPAGSTDDELKLFVGQCNRTGLDPFARQIYAIKSRGKIKTIVGIDGFRIIAERSGRYTGQKGPWWCGIDGKWVDVWIDSLAPVAARVGVLRSDFAEPLYAVAKLSSYTTGRDVWKQMPEVMIAKVAEALALRRAFPHDLSGLYTADEMDQAVEPAGRYLGGAQSSSTEARAGCLHQAGGRAAHHHRRQQHGQRDQRQPVDDVPGKDDGRL